MRAAKMDPNLVFIDYDPCDAAGVYDNSMLVADLATLTPKPRTTHARQFEIPKPTPSHERVITPLELHLSLQK